MPCAARTSSRPDDTDQYRMHDSVSCLKFERRAPCLITRLNDSKPKHQYPLGGPQFHTSEARCERKWCLGRRSPVYSGTRLKRRPCSNCKSSITFTSLTASLCCTTTEKSSTSLHQLAHAGCEVISSVNSGAKMVILRRRETTGQSKRSIDGTAGVHAGRVQAGRRTGEARRGCRQSRITCEG